MLLQTSMNGIAYGRIQIKTVQLKQSNNRLTDSFRIILHYVLELLPLMRKSSLSMGIKPRQHIQPDRKSVV